MRQGYAQGRTREFFSVVAAEVGALKQEVKNTFAPFRGFSKKYVQAVMRGRQALLGSFGVAALLLALSLSVAFETPYVLKIVLLLSFTLSFSIWASRDIVVEEASEMRMMHEDIGFGIATIVLAIGVAGSFIMRQANLWLIGALAILVITKSLFAAYQKGTAKKIPS